MIVAPLASSGPAQCWVVVRKLAALVEWVEWVVLHCPMLHPMRQQHPTRLLTRIKVNYKGNCRDSYRAKGRARPLVIRRVLVTVYTHRINLLHY